MFVLCHYDFCALSRVSFEDTAITLLLKYDFTSIDKSILSNLELWRCSSQWALCSLCMMHACQSTVWALPPSAHLCTVYWLHCSISHHCISSSETRWLLVSRMPTNSFCPASLFLWTTLQNPFVRDYKSGVWLKKFQLEPCIVFCFVVWYKFATNFLSFSRGRGSHSVARRI